MYYAFGSHIYDLSSMTTYVFLVLLTFLFSVFMSVALISSVTAKLTASNIFTFVTYGALQHQRFSPKFRMTFL